MSRPTHSLPERCKAMNINLDGFVRIVTIKAMQGAIDVLDKPEPGISDIRQARKHLIRAIELVKGEL